MPTRYYIIAGEASGDLHGSNLIKALIKTEPDAIIRCWGGDLMEAAGATLVKHYRELAFMGFWEVIKTCPPFFATCVFVKKIFNNLNRMCLYVSIIPDSICVLQNGLISRT